MLLEFKCSNFRSINTEVDFNMQATSDKKFEDNLVEFDGKKFLKSAEIYGPNGSGKSTLLTAIHLMKQMVCLSNDNKPSKRDNLPYSPHKLNENNPTSFSIWFEKNGKKFFYEFSYFSDKVVEENLYYCEISSKKMITVFERDNNDFVSGTNFKNDFGNCDKELKDKKLLLSVAADITNIKPIAEAFSFFDDDIIIWMEGKYYNWTKKNAKELQSNMNTREQYVSFLKNICPGLQNISAKVNKKFFSDSDLPEEMPESLKKSLIEKGITSLDIKFDYGIFVNELREESSGTNLIFDMLCPLMDVIVNNKILIIDELETHLHPAIVKEILRFFYQNADSKSQLIFTTHNMELLDQNIIRRDQVWFTELKQEGRETELYSLAEYNGVRNDENLRRGYIEHRYGSWPNIEQF